MLVARVVTAFVFISFSTGSLAQDEGVLTSNKEIASYAFGTQFATQVLRTLETQPVPLDNDALLLGISDVLSGSGLRLDMSTMQAAVTAFQAEIEQARVQGVQENLTRAMDFLNENQHREGVVQTESGLQYKILSSGEGASPLPEDLVVVHYRGKLLDGTEFDSSHSRGEPAQFHVNQVIAGWQEVLQLMKPGDRWEVYISPELAYGERGAGATIGPNELLIFEVDLLEVKSAQESTE